MNEFEAVKSILDTWAKEIARLKKQRQLRATMLKSWILTITERRYYQKEMILLTGKINTLKRCYEQLKAATWIN